MNRPLNFSELREANITRQRVLWPSEKWNPVDWSNAFAGEAGEVCNAVKKLRRIADGTNTAKDPQTEFEAIEAIGDEIADAIIYADLLAAKLGIDLSRTIRSKYNKVSDRYGCNLKL